MATLDHVVPRADGGSNHHSNVVTACHDCNSRRSDLPAEKFAFMLACRFYVNQENAWEDALGIITRVCRAMGRELPP